jgi:hypothetical protein
MNERVGIGFALAFPVIALGTGGGGDGDLGHLSLRKTSYQWSSARDSSQRRIVAALDTAGTVPMDGKSAFGYAWLSDGGNNVLVLVTHLPIDDSSHEAEGSGFHTHVLDLKEPTAACAGANFEVDVEGSRQNSAFDADYRWKVKGSRVAVQDVPTADLGDGGIEAVTAFTLKPILESDGKPSHLCVTVTDQL